MTTQQMRGTGENCMRSLPVTSQTTASLLVMVADDFASGLVVDG